jgi:hypothetical protein
MTTSYASFPGRITNLDIRELINPLPSQERFLNEMYRREYLLFGGAAGPGKSYILRWAAVEILLYWASQGHSGVRVGLFCEDYVALKDRQVSRMEREFPRWLGSVRNTVKEGLGFYMNEEYGGGTISLRNLDDPAKYASSEFAAIFVDELTKNPRQTFEDLRFRKRWPGIAHSPFAAGSNPGSIGHSWVKQLFVDRDFSGDNSLIDPDSVAFIPARAGENPYLPSSYWELLNSLPEAMRRAMLDGDWTIFAGQVFYHEWREELHVIEPFSIPPDWPRWVAVDYGFASPFCALWLTKHADDLYAYREMYAAGWSAGEQAKRINAASQAERISLYVGDPSMWAKREKTVGESLAGEYLQQGITLRKANNDRLAGLNAIREMLQWKELPGPPARVIKPPRLRFFSNCRNTIRTLPSLPYDTVRTEDVDTDAEDHPYDALRYGVMVVAGPKSAERPHGPISIYDR